MKRIIHYLTVLVMTAVMFLPAVTAYARNYAKPQYSGRRWKLIAKDELKTDTDRLIYVRYRGGTVAKVQMWKKVEAEPAAEEKDPAKTDADKSVVGNLTAGKAKKTVKYKWKKLLSTKGYVGRNGLDKVRQGDVKTPTGKFHITMAFGIKPSPGTAGIGYTKLNRYHYWSGERATYNTFVDVRTLGRSSVAGEHLITYVPFYNYALAMDYNKNCTYLKGSAIFVHCTKPGRPYTGGCVAVSESKMRKIVRNTTEHTLIAIYPE